MPTLEGQAVLHDIQATEHEDFYRVVVEFAGESDQETTGELGWFIGWTESLASQGKGAPIALDKKTVLELNIEGTTAPVTPELETLYYSGPQEFSVGEITVVDDGTFESLTHIGIGMDAERPFQVRQLGNPLRLIVDIQK
ncbi:MAG: hypothetical protein CSA82_03075 [Actinobacteria bacterium]|nr:MAG: hypothetical protein CSA82_03075 [Actinomycetota bacterium]